jgi:hypothetical protein
MSQVDVFPSPNLDPSTEPPSKWQCERAAYWRLLPSLFSHFRGQYVAVHEGQVVDSGDDEVELALRVYRRFGYVPIYVGHVADEPYVLLGRDFLNAYRILPDGPQSRLEVE